MQDTMMHPVNGPRGRRGLVNNRQILVNSSDGRGALTPGWAGQGQVGEGQERAGGGGAGGGGGVGRVWGMPPAGPPRLGMAESENPAFVLGGFDE